MYSSQNVLETRRPWMACQTQDDLIEWLRGNGDYEILKKVRPACTAQDRPCAIGEREAVIVDVESSMPDAQGKRHIKSIGLVVFQYDKLTHRPSCRVTRSVTLTPVADRDGIWHVTSDAGMSGLPQQVTAGDVAEWIASAAWVISHFAEFDRPLVESVFPAFAQKPWACSCHGVDWMQYGIRCKKLEYLTMLAHGWYTAHRPEPDCHAVLAVLSCETPDRTRTLLDVLLNNARQDVVVVRMAANPGVPFSRQRGYRIDGDWLVGTFSPADYSDELEALQPELRQGLLPRRCTIYRLSPTDRYSGRTGILLPPPKRGP